MYQLTAQADGFKSSVVEDVGAGEPTSFVLEIGSLTEAVHVLGRPGTTPDAGRGRAGRSPVDPSRWDEWVAGCTLEHAGGNVVPPSKVTDVRPRYPAASADAGIEGDVIIEARISTTGEVTNAQLLKSAHPDLDAAAMAATQSWQYQPTLLNCQPVEVLLTVLVRFTVES